VNGNRDADASEDADTIARIMGARLGYGCWRTTRNGRIFLPDNQDRRTRERVSRENQGNETLDLPYRLFPLFWVVTFTILFGYL